MSKQKQKKNKNKKREKKCVCVCVQKIPFADLTMRKFCKVSKRL